MCLFFVLKVEKATLEKAISLYLDGIQSGFKVHKPDLNYDRDHSCFQ